MGKYLTKTGLTKYTAKLKEYISKAKVASAASADNATKVNNHIVNTDVPANAKFTDTTYKEATTASAGLLGTEDKKYLDTLKPLVVPTNEEGNTSLDLITTDGLSIQHASASETNTTTSVAITDSQAQIGMGNVEVNIEGLGVNITANNSNDINITTTEGNISTTGNNIGISSSGDTGITLSTVTDVADIEFRTKAPNERSGITVVNKVGSTSLANIGDGTMTGAIKAAYEKPVVGRVTAGAKAGSTIGQYVTAEGYNDVAFGDVSHAEGSSTTARGAHSHAEGAFTTASGLNSHAEGSSGTASGESSHAEGNATTASGRCSHAEGDYTTASGDMSHASGCATQATRRGSYSEGLAGKATGVGAHVEGTYTIGYMGQGDDYYTEVNVTIKEIPASQLNTVKTTTGLTDVKYYMYYTNDSSALSYLPDAIQAGIDNGGDVVHLFDNPIMTDEFYSFTSSQVKQATISSVINKPAMYFGNSYFTNESIIKSLLNKNLEKIWIAVSFNINYTLSTASGAASHCEGGGNTASGHYSHAEGVCTTASGIRSHAQGNTTTASGITAFASGCSTEASGQSSFAGGVDSTASGFTSFAVGQATTASGNYSFSEGFQTIAENRSCHASGWFTKASNENSYAMGHFNAAMTTGGTSSNKVGTALAIGNGSNDSAGSNAFSVQFSGITKAANTITASTTADYAEFFEWLDENPNAEDRVGYFVTLDGDKIKIAEADDDYILGVISGAPFVLGNGDCDVWNGMYLRDEFRRLKEEPAPKVIQVKNKETKKYENQVVEGEYEGTRFVLNPNYDSSQEYKSRFDRPEWAAVGILGVLPVRHDGTARVNGYVTVGANGIATACERTAENAYRVIKENSDSVVEIIFR